MAMSTMIKSLEDIMRKDAGLNGDAQYIEQITWLLFLKAFDAKEMEWEFRPDYKGVIPQGYRWRDWAADKEGVTGDALIKFIDELFDKLKKLDTSDGDMRKFVVRNVFEDINNYMKSGVYLRQLVNRINEKVDFIDATQKHTFNELYEGMLKDLQSAGRAGEFYTPRPVTNFIVEKVDPKLGEIVLDPACGTGGFLTSTIAHIGSAKTVEEFEMSNSSGIIKNILDLAWLAPRNGLNIEEISGNATEKNNAYILESNTVVNDEEKRNENYTDNIWLRIVRYPVEKDVGTSVLEYKDILIYAEGEDAYIAMQSLENTELWTLWKIPTYGDWLYKEIALFMRIRTGL